MIADDDLIEQYEGDHSEHLRRIAGWVIGTDRRRILEAADRIDWLEDTTNEQVMLIDALEAERDAAARLLSKLGYNRNEYLP